MILTKMETKIVKPFLKILHMSLIKKKKKEKIIHMSISS